MLCKKTQIHVYICHLKRNTIHLHNSRPTIGLSIGTRANFGPILTREAEMRTISVVPRAKILSARTLIPHKHDAVEPAVAAQRQIQIVVEFVAVKIDSLNSSLFPVRPE